MKYHLSSSNVPTGSHIAVLMASQIAGLNFLLDDSTDFHKKNDNNTREQFPADGSLNLDYDLKIHFQKPC